MQITAATLQTIAETSIEKAQSLVEEAMLLEENAQYPKAFTCFQLGIDSLGKAIECIVFLVFRKFNDPKEKKDFIKNSRRRGYKIDKAVTLDYFITQVKLTGHYDKVMTLIQEVSDDKILERLQDAKEISLYSSYYKDACKTKKVTPADTAGMRTKALDLLAMTTVQAQAVLTNLPALWKYIDSSALDKPYTEKRARKWWGGLLGIKDEL
jgi:AbiV family abortive infection protein